MLSFVKQTLSESITGFTTLKSTYTDDSITVARLTLIINKLTFKVILLLQDYAKIATKRLLVSCLLYK